MPKSTEGGQVLSDKQQRFVDEYLKDLNGARAAIAAGYSPKSAPRQAQHLLAQPHVQLAVQQAKERASAEADISSARILRELALLGFANIGDIIDVSGDFPRICLQDASRDVLATISEISVDVVGNVGNEPGPDGERDLLPVTRVKVKQYNKLAALDLLGQHAGLWGKKSDAVDDSETARMFVQLVRSLAGTIPAAPPAEPPGGLGT